MEHIVAKGVEATEGWFKIVGKEDLIFIYFTLRRPSEKKKGEGGVHTSIHEPKDFLLTFRAYTHLMRWLMYF